VIEFPLNAAALFSVISKAKTPERRQRAAELMLIEVGFPEDEARDLAEKMYHA
jgi:Mn-dependent DtxR family transcriptional regulator